MHAVGHVADRHFVYRPTGKERRENLSTHLSVQSTHAIDRPTSAHRQVSHVERLHRVVGILATERQKLAQRKAQVLLREPSEILLDQGRRKAVKTCGDGGVRGEEIPRTSGRQGNGKSMSGPLHETMGTL